ncbi:MAG: hypothetical protein H7A39_02985 [Chlamydiales bacterium]|nr:hypothetical protein [Chlamydiales bacterium]
MVKVFLTFGGTMIRVLVLCALLLSAAHVEARNAQPRYSFPDYDFRLGTSILEFFCGQLKAAYENKPLPVYTRKYPKQTPLDTKFLNLLNRKFSISEHQVKRLRTISNKSQWLGWDWNPWFWPNKVEYCTYIDIIREISQKIIPETLEELNLKPKIDVPVIHYRLSDVPFCRSLSHHLQYYAYYEMALDKLKAEGIDVSEIVVLYTFKNGYHKNLNISRDQFIEINKEYLNDFIGHLNSKGYKVTVQSKSVLEDFATMVFAPAVIGSESMFCLFSGLANKHPIIFPLLGKEHQNHYGPTHNIPAFISPIQPLLHCNVKNYYDYKDVFAKLRQQPPA